jgi:hypothetical protein
VLAQHRELPVLSKEFPEASEEPLCSTDMLTAALLHVLLAAQGINPQIEEEPPARIAQEEAAAAEPDTSESEDAEAEADDAEPPPGAPDVRYTADLSDEQVELLWKESPAELGSISMGFADRGRLINGVHMPADPAWMLQRPDLAWGTRETVEGLAAAFRAVHEQFPGSAPARLSHIGGREGGYLRPHRSHQSGRDADVAFFYRNDIHGFGRHREKQMDPARNWALIRALLTLADVQFILVDRGIQKVLRDHALRAGEDPVWVDTLFHGGKHGMIQHAKHHRDHFHVRFFAPRSQELGRRIQPLLAQRPDQNLAFHRVKRGQTLGKIARIYRTSTAAILKANHLRRTALRLNQQLVIPVRGACTRCPVPPPVVVPPRLLPPRTTLAADASVSTPAALIP